VARAVLMDLRMLALATLLAVAIGIALGLLGGGGSILTVPILRYTLHMPAHTAVAGSLFVVAVTSAVALVSHARGGRVRWRTGLLFGTTGMIGAYAAGRVAHLIPGSILLLSLAAMMIATSIAMLRPRKAGVAVHVGELPIGKVLAEGLVVGAVTGLVGAGGGFLVVPALAVLGGLPLPIAIGTSLLVIAMKSTAGLLGYLGTTDVPWTPVLAVTAAAVVGSLLGGRWVGRIDERVLRRGFGLFVLAMAGVVLWQELAASM
jgi:uncharacterized membrane protein YfcA